MQDLLSVFLTVPYEGGQFMTGEVIKDNILFVFAAGFETSSNTMANTLKFLAETPSILAEVRKGKKLSVPPLHCFNGCVRAYFGGRWGIRRRVCCV